MKKIAGNRNYRLVKEAVDRGPDGKRPWNPRGPKGPRNPAAFKLQKEVERQKGLIKGLKGFIEDITGAPIKQSNPPGGWSNYQRGSVTPNTSTQVED